MVRAVDQATPGSNDAYFDAALFEKSLRLTKKSFAGAQNRMLKAVATPPSVAKLVILGNWAAMPSRYFDKDRGSHTLAGGETLIAYRRSNSSQAAKNPN
ncbi:MAG: hypothetical protein LQ337_008469 [Flavoplaca oasis]|nr:MAG: hypothetical protein LQ337_008469 [Flavoplaca oasis]